MNPLDVFSLLDFVIDCFKHWRLSVCVAVAGGLALACIPFDEEWVCPVWLRLTIFTIALMGGGFVGWLWDHKKQ